MYQVVSFGSAVLDIMVKSAELKVLKSHEVKGGIALCEVYGGKAEVDQILMTTGGGAVNTAISFRRMGLTAAPVAKIGSDETGQLIRANLQKEKIGLDLLITEVGQSATSVILVAPDGGRSILTARGVAAQLTSADINWDKLYQTKWFYISSLGGRFEVLEDILSFAKKQGIKVALNPGKQELAQGHRLKKNLHLVDVLLVNRLELSQLLGVEFEATEDLIKGSRGLCKIVVMSEGKRGATAIRPHELTRAAAFKVESVDDTGAGDAFGSGLIYGLIKGYSIKDALRIGSANGAAEVTKLGAHAGVLAEKEIGKWLEKKLVIVEEALT